jgi:hypothetical protein
LALNRQVVTALREAARGAGQSEEMANRLVSWLDQVAAGGASLDNLEDVNRHIQELLEEVRPEDKPNDLAVDLEDIEL